MVVTTHAVGTIVLVSYEESVPLDRSDESDGSSEDETLSAPAIVLSNPDECGRLKVAWLLPVHSITLPAGHRRPTRWTGRGQITHVLDSSTLRIDIGDVAPHPDVAACIIDAATVYDSATATLVPGTTYAAFLAMNMVV